MYIKKFNVIFHPFAEEPPVDGFASKLAQRFVSRYNELWQFIL